MPKKVPFAKGRRICPFCQGISGSPISGEHIWPDWASDILPERSSRREFNIIMTEGHTNVKEVIKDYTRQGPPSGVKIRLPCKTCNETWMGRIEEGAKSYLLPLITGNRVSLTQHARESLTRWLFLKFMVLDGAGASVPANTPDAYAKFRADQVVPYDFKVWVGITEAQEWKDNYRMHSFSVRQFPNEKGTMEGKISTLLLLASEIYSSFLYSILPSMQTRSLRGTT